MTNNRDKEIEGTFVGKPSAQETFKKLSQKSVPSKTGDQQDSLGDKINEALFYIHKIKNGMSVKTGENEALTRIYTGQKMFVDTRDLSLAPHILLDGEWEPNISKILDRLIRPGCIMIDIGASFGYFSIIAGRQMNRKKNPHIYLIEANPVFIPYLRKSLSINGLLELATISNIGLSDRSETITLNVLEDIWASSSAHDEVQLRRRIPFEFKVSNRISLKAITLDEYAEKNGIREVDVIKMDIEGYEEKAYRGMTGIIENSPELIMLLEFNELAYDNPEGFFKQIKQDFKCVYGVDNDLPHLQLLKEYQDIAAMNDRDWIMLVLSKKPLRGRFE